MSDMNYVPNSHKSKAETSEKRVEKPVIAGQVKVKKKNEMQKIADAFISEDAANVKSYIVTDVLIPAVKKLVTDIIKDGIDMILYGETRGSNKRPTADRVSYNKYYGRDEDRFAPRSTSSRYSYDDITMDSRGEAEAVRAALDDIVDAYGHVRVADLYDLVGITGEYTDNNYGWFNVRNVEIIRTRDGRYALKMPRAVPIK